MTGVVPLHPMPPVPRLPPHNFEAEMALLGAILANNRAYDAVSESLKPEHFADERHGRIFAACAALIERGMHATGFTVSRYFEQDGALSELGGAEYLARLGGGTMSIRNAKDYGWIILDCWQRRRMIEAIGAQMEACYAPPIEEGQDAPISGEAIAERLAGALTAIQAGGDSGGPRPLGDAVARAIEATGRAAQGGGGITGVPTGLIDLDKVLGGLQAPDLVIVAGRTSMGKTAFAQTMLRGAAAAGKRCLVFSLEMGAEQLGQRELSHATGIGADRQRQGRVSNEDIGQLVVEHRRIAGLPIFVDDTPSISPQRIRARALRQKRRHGLDLVVIDYLQLIGGVEADTRHMEISKITKAIKATAKTLGVPIVLLSQLSRKLEDRDDKRPQLSDLRESGAIEEDADVVIMLYRHEYYLARRDPQRRANEDDEKFAKRRARHFAELDQWRGIAEALIEKNRQGPTATVRLRWDAGRACFENLAEGRDGEG